VAERNFKVSKLESFSGGVVSRSQTIYPLATWEKDLVAT